MNRIQSSSLDGSRALSRGVTDRLDLFQGQGRRRVKLERNPLSSKCAAFRKAELVWMTAQDPRQNFFSSSASA